MVNITTELLLDLKQAAQRCGVSVKTIRNWSSRATEPRLETAKLGGKVVTTLEALQRFTVQKVSGEHETRQSAAMARHTNATHEEAMQRLKAVHGVSF